MFAFSNDNKRYHTWNYHLRHTFGGKVGKVTLDGGFTCPNIDGRKGTGGCVYCSPRGSGDFAGNAAQSIAEQYESQRTQMLQKWPGAGSLAYFQAHSGTYAPVEQLRCLYEQALSCPGVVGLCIATRADLLPPDVLALLQEIGQRTWLLVELGLQTVHDRTAHQLNRCHTYAEFLEGYSRLQEAGIRCCIHIINGLPGESYEQMMQTAEEVGRLRPHSVKIHMLHVLEGAGLAQMHADQPLSFPTMEEYIALVCDQLERLPPEIVLQRLTGDAGITQLIAPDWLRYKRRILNGIDKELARRESWQGKHL